MDAETLMAAIAISKTIPGTAAERAETAAAIAEQYGYSLAIEGDTLVIGEEDDA